MLLIIFLIFMIVAAIIALEIKNLLSSVVALGALGSGISICFLMLGAPEIAITQMAVEILLLIILVRATISRDLTYITTQREIGGLVTIGVFMGLFVLLSVFALELLPKFGNPLMAVSSYYIKNGFADVNAANAVSAIMLGYRGIDTLGEAAILLASIVGAIVLLRPKGRKEVDEVDPD